MAEANVDQIRAALAGVQDPEIGRRLDDLHMLGDVTVDDGTIKVGVELPTPAYPERERIGAALTAAAKSFGLPVTVDYTWRVRGKESGGTIGLHVKNIIAVGSGKGGVGKSTIAASLAFGLQKSGAKVGLMDADVYGPSIPHLTGATGEPTVKEVRGPNGESLPRVEPIESQGLKLLSIGFQIEKDQAVVWRGPMLHRQLTLFLQHTDWGDLDYLVIDMPPGTGDVALSLSQMVQAAGAVVVCSPQQVALLDAMKAISMFRTVKIPVLGMVENLSGDVFGRGGARAMAEEMGVPFLGEVPCDAAIRIQGDEGRIASLFDAESPVRDALMHVCERTAIEVAKQTLQSSALPTLEIL